MNRKLEMSSLSRELVFLILQFLEEEKFKESVHRYNLFLPPFIFFIHFLGFLKHCSFVLSYIYFSVGAG